MTASNAQSEQYSFSVGVRPAFDLDVRLEGVFYKRDRAPVDVSHMELPRDVIMLEVSWR